MKRTKTNKERPGLAHFLNEQPENPINEALLLKAIQAIKHSEGKPNNNNGNLLSN